MTGLTMNAKATTVKGNRAYPALRKALRDAGRTHDECAHVLGISVTSFSYRMTGKCDWKLSEMWELMRLTNQPPVAMGQLFTQ